MSKINCSIKIRLATDDVFFGPGVFALLNLIEKHESVNAAAKAMDLSYSKAMKMIHGTEEALGFKILDRKIGGTHGGGSRLTPECIEFLNAYEKFSFEIKEFSDNLFNKYFNKYL